MGKKNIHWSEVVEIDKSQPAAKQRLSREVMDFWQQHDPELFNRIAETANYRNGKVRFGFDINKGEGSDSCHFRHTTRHHSVNMSSSQLGTIGMISADTGIARRMSVEEVAHHELTHAGDIKLVRGGEELQARIDAAMPHSARIVSESLDYMAGKGDKEAASLKRDLLPVLESGQKLVAGKDFEKTMEKFFNYVSKNEEELLSYVNSSPHLRDSLKELGKIQKHSESYEKFVASREEWTVKTTDHAMKKIDPENRRKIYANGMDFNDSAKEEISYARGTAVRKNVYPETSSFHKWLENIEKSGQELQEIYKTGMIDLRQMEKVAGDLQSNAYSLDGHTGLKEHNLSSPIRSDSVSHYHAASSAADFRKDAKDINKHLATAKTRLGELETALESGDEKKIRGAKQAFAKASDKLVAEVGEALERVEKVADKTFNMATRARINDATLEKNNATVEEIAAALRKDGVKAAVSGDYLKVDDYYIPATELRKMQQEFNGIKNKIREK